MTTPAVVIYRPAHVRETIVLNGKLISCGEASLSMLVDAVTLGGVTVPQTVIRAMSSEPVPDPASPGLSLRQLVGVASKLRISLIDKTGSTWDDFVRYLGEDRRAIVQLQNATLHDCKNYRVGHAMFVQAKRSMGILADNPLCTSASWYSPSVFRQAMEDFANASGVPGNGLRFAISRTVPRIVKP